MIGSCYEAFKFSFVPGNAEKKYDDNPSLRLIKEWDKMEDTVINCRNGFYISIFMVSIATLAMISNNIMNKRGFVLKDPSVMYISNGLGILGGILGIITAISLCCITEKYQSLSNQNS